MFPQSVQIDMVAYRAWYIEKYSASVWLIEKPTAFDQVKPIELIEGKKYVPTLIYDYPFIYPSYIPVEFVTGYVE